MASHCGLRAQFVGQRRDLDKTRVDQLRQSAGREAVERIFDLVDIKES